MRLQEKKNVKSSPKLYVHGQYSTRNNLGHSYIGKLSSAQILLLNKI